MRNNIAKIIKLIKTAHHNAVRGYNIYNLAGRWVSAFNGPSRITTVKLGGK